MIYWTLENQINTQIALTYTKNEKNEFLVKSNDQLNSPYRSTFYLPFVLWELVVASRIEKPLPMEFDKEELELSGGDCLIVEWFGLKNFNKNDEVSKQVGLEEKIKHTECPQNISIVLGNINGANGDTYSRHTVSALKENNHMVVFSHWRNSNWCEDREPKTFQTFTDTEDVNCLIQHVHSKFPKANIFLVGMSQGGQMFLRWTAQHNVSYSFQQYLTVLGL